MAEAPRVQQNRYPPHEPCLGPRPERSLNPIIEEDSDDGRRSLRVDISHRKIEAWLSPMSDHFPTPRGVHYLPAPILPSSPSTLSGAGSSPTNSSNLWNRASVATENTEFEDLYDVSEDEAQDDGPRALRRPASVRGLQAEDAGTDPEKRPARLAIPAQRSSLDEGWTAVDELKKMTSPAALTPSVQLPMSPAQIDFMGKQQAVDVPTISAPPSLDGSLSSEQLATMSAPPTPVTGDEKGATEEAWTGVLLQPGALATLQALSSVGEGDMHEQPSRVIEIPQAGPQPTREMLQQSLRIITSTSLQATHRHTLAPSPRRHSLADLTRLEIPSPGGFFSNLSPRTQSTWHMQPKATEDLLPPPTSTTAEQFYRCPWNADPSVPPVPRRPDSAEVFYRGFESSSSMTSAPVEHIVEVQDDVSDGIPTARPFVPHHDGETIRRPTSPDVEDALAEIVSDYDPNYARKQQKVALSNLDRTELWLRAQRAYLKSVVEPDGEWALVTIEEALEEEEEEDSRAVVEVELDKGAGMRKRVVRFSDVIPTSVQPRRLPPKFLRQESAYYRAFQDYIIRTQPHDVFVHQLSRFEALQAQRVALRETHRNQLLGKYQLSVVPQSAKKRLSANVARGDLNLTDDPEKLRKEKELEASSQMAMPAWHVAAVKFLNGGRLVSAPVTKRLARLSRLSSGENGTTRDRARVLDLGGQSTCDWAWHCALQYPNAKVYTVTTKAIRQLSNSNIRGPPNHRQVAVGRLTRLPFADNQFDLVSARELHSILKFVGENGEDEWESCLKECMRVLKPGGYLEFSILDSDIMNAGPLGLAKSVEFGFALKTLGYDPSPTRMWLGRLARAGFGDIRRVWMCLPLGAKRRMHAPPKAVVKGASGPAGRVHQMDAMVMGSSDDIASVCSIVGGWSWERWLLRCEMEKVAGELRLADTVTTGEAMREAGKCLEGVHAVMEEGRGCRAGFRMLNGYAMKPKAGIGRS